MAAFGAGPAAPAVEVLSVQAAPFTLWPGAQAQFEEVRRGLLAAARTTADTAVSRLDAAGFAATGVARIGPPADLVLEEAREGKVTAIAMGTRGHGVAGGFAIGSTALRVAQGGAAPVFLVKPGDRLPAAPSGRLRVLLAADGSDPPVRAAERLLAWRDWLGDLSVDVAWIQPSLTVLEAVIPPHDDVLRHWSAREAEAAVEAVVAVLGSARLEHRVHRGTGEPSAGLAALAARTGAELIVLGTRGLGAMHHAVVGSVALKTCVAGEVPTLLVP